jgi:hypothetical protein
MSLDVAKLEKVRHLANGVIQARCPACAESGGDQKGEHLRIYGDGRFGCCVHPKDGEHRKRIYALAGERERREFSVKVAPVRPPGLPRSVKESLAGLISRAAVEAVHLLHSGPSAARESHTDSRTLRTHISNPRAYEKKESSCNIYKDWSTGVPGVLNRRPQPYLTALGDLVIPFQAPERYHWWKGGQSVKETRNELLSRDQSLPY